MSSSVAGRPSRPPLAVHARATADHLVVALADGREVTVPVAWFEWLSAASDAERADVVVVEDGSGIWWPRLDEGLSVAGLLGLPEAP